MKKQAFHIVTRAWLLLVIFIFVFFNAKADLFFNNINSDQGLSSNSVNAVFRDKLGYLWIGTNLGLNRYDGLNMKVFKQNISTENSLNNSYVYSIKQEADGTLWILTKGGFCIYDYRQENFDTDFKTFLGKRNVQFTHLQNVFFSKEYTAHVVDNYNVIIHSHLSKKNIQLARANPERKYIAGAFDSKNTLWMVDSKFNLYSVNPNTGEIKTINTNIEQNEYLRGEIIIDKRDNLWITVNTSVLYFYNTKTGTTTNLNKSIEGQSFSSFPIRSVIEDEFNNIWVGTDHGGITLINPLTFKATTITENANESNSLSENTITTLHSDVEGTVWVGTFKQGVDYYHPLNRRFKTIKLPGSVSSNDINCFAEYPNGDLLIGTNGKGLFRYSRSTNTFTQIQYSKNAGKDNTVVSLLIDSKERLWIGTFMDGLYCYTDNKFLHYSINTKGQNELQLPDENIWSIVEDADANIWVGTLNIGLFKIDEKNNKLIPLKGTKNPHATIESAYRDNENYLWIGSSWGFYILNPQGEIDQLIEFNKNKDRFAERNYINSIVQDKKGYYWIATQAGLAIFDKQTKKYHFFTSEEGLDNKVVHMILVDEDNCIWTSTSTGIYKIKVLDYSDFENLKTKVIHFSKEDGLQDNKFNGKSAFKTKDNKLIFGGVNGFNIIDPRSLQSKSTTSNIVLTNLFLNNKLVSIGDSVNGRVVLNSSLSHSSKIVLKYNENTISIGFVALGFLHPEKYKYEYRLKGLSDEWVSVSTGEPIAAFNNLSRGIYNFEVRIKETESIKNEKVATIKIEILPPFWLSWSAFLLYFLIATAIIIFIYRYLVDRATFTLRLNQELQERKHIEEISAMKVKFFTNLSHELRTPVSLIILPVENMLSKNIDAGTRNNLTMVLRNAKRLLFIVNQLLDFRKLEVGEITYHPVTGNMVSFIKDVTLPFMDIAQNKNIKLTVKSNVEELYTNFDHNKLERILFNLLSNAFKFTSNHGSVVVNIKFNEENKLPIRIEVSDTGIGIDKSKIANIFKPFYQADNQGGIADMGTGIGLSITYEFVRLHKGEIFVESEIDKGTTFIIELPMTEERAPVIKEDLPEEELVVSAETMKIPTIDSISKKARTVLIVDDNDDFRFYLVENLRCLYNIIEANNGQIAYEKANRFIPDLIVSDVTMPIMDGFEFCKKIKTEVNTSHIPVILLTANTLNEDKITGFEAGADEYVSKPFNVGVLKARIRNLLIKKDEQRSKLNANSGIDITEVNLPSLDEKLIEKVNKYTMENIADADFGIEKLSKKIGMSTVYLNKKISALTGKTTSEYVRSLRLKKATQLLEKSDLSISEIAYEVGYNSPKYFSKYFKDEYGILPSEYRKNYI